MRAAAIGECMVELSHRDERTLALGFGGDTLNTAVYLARSNAPDRLAVDYVTALGDDPYSERMIESWRAEGIGTDLVARLPGRLPGLYFIRLDDQGERRFFYYRSAAAARELFRDKATLPALAALPGYDLVYFSLITLSILADEARDRLFAALGGVRAKGGRVAFDTNYRPAGWPDRYVARRVIERFLAIVDIALPTADDERALFGDESPEGTAARYAEKGVAEVAIKLGAEGCLVCRGAERRRIPVPEPVEAVDTTAAGDAFNAGYLTLRLAGRPIEDAASAGHRLAGVVVQHRGAIIPRQATPAILP